MAIPGNLKIVTEEGVKEYKFTMLRVVSRKENGTPEELTMICEEDQVELSTNEKHNHFIGAYIPVEDYSKHAGDIPTIGE